METLIRGLVPWPCIIFITMVELHDQAGQPTTQPEQFSSRSVREDFLALPALVAVDREVLNRGGVLEAVGQVIVALMTFPRSGSRCPY